MTKSQPTINQFCKLWKFEKFKIINNSRHEFRTAFFPMDLALLSNQFFVVSKRINWTQIMESFKWQNGAEQSSKKQSLIYFNHFKLNKNVLAVPQPLHSILPIIMWSALIFRSLEIHNRILVIRKSIEAICSHFNLR